uniref:Uncharacterized protein n=1 Tax=Oryza rufipogon TaxID=4529 RepID=A0A0E0R4C4_ORYRU
MFIFAHLVYLDGDSSCLPSKPSLLDTSKCLDETALSTKRQPLKMTAVVS